MLTHMVSRGEHDLIKSLAEHMQHLAQRAELAADITSDDANIEGAGVFKR